MQASLLAKPAMQPTMKPAPLRFSASATMRSADGAAHLP